MVSITQPAPGNLNPNNYEKLVAKALFSWKNKLPVLNITSPRMPVQPFYLGMDLEDDHDKEASPTSKIPRKDTHLRKP